MSQLAMTLCLTVAVRSSSLDASGKVAQSLQSRGAKLPHLVLFFLNTSQLVMKCMKRDTHIAYNISYVV